MLPLPLKHTHAILSNNIRPVKIQIHIIEVSLSNTHKHNWVKYIMSDVMWTKQVPRSYYEQSLAKLCGELRRSL